MVNKKTRDNENARLKNKIADLENQLSMSKGSVSKDVKRNQDFIDKMIEFGFMSKKTLSEKYGETIVCESPSFIPQDKIDALSEFTGVNWVKTRTTVVKEN